MQASRSQRIDYALVSAPLLPMVHHIGYEPINGSTQSDHRGMYIDLSTNVLKHVAIAPPRKLNASHGTQVAKYRAKLATILTEKGIQQTIHTLTQRHKLNRWNKPQTKRLEHIDREITAAMLQAEITSRPAHTAPWLPAIQEAYEAVQAINQELRRLVPNARHNTHPTPDNHSVLRNIWTRRLAAIKELRHTRKRAYELRQT